MKTSDIALHIDRRNDEEASKKTRASKLVKFILVIFLSGWISLMSSCMLSFGFPFYYGHGGYGHHGYYGHGGHWGHH
jgi:hypothetical protein